MQVMGHLESGGVNMEVPLTFPFKPSSTFLAPFVADSPSGSTTSISSQPMKALSEPVAYDAMLPPKLYIDPNSDCAGGLSAILITTNGPAGDFRGESPL